MSSETPTGAGAGSTPDVGEVVRFEVVEHDDGAVVVAVYGEIDTMTAPAVGEQLSGRLARAQLVVVDLSGVTFLGSAGLAVLVAGKDEADRAGKRLRLVAGSHTVTRALEATGLITVFDVRDGVPDALRAAG